MERWQSWLIALASKASNGSNPFVGSNPTLSARLERHRMPMPRKTARTIDEYIKRHPADVRERLEKMRETISKAAPDAVEAISYQIPTFRLNGNLVHFAAFAHHIGFYPTSSGTRAFEEELAPYKWAKGSLQFPLDKPIPYGLVRRIVKFRSKENKAKKK